MMRNYWNILLLFCLFFCSRANAQNQTQTVRGTVMDKVSQTPLPGVIVMVLHTDPLKGASTDAEGNFKLLNVPVGKQSLKVSFIGYREVTLRDLSVNAGKELVLTVSMEEDVNAMEEVVIKAKIEKNKPLNGMSAVSARTFSVEETQKFAAAINDPARMATSFAGVISADDGNNNISIRGNSPNGLQWRMEGVEIPNPNHFSAVGTSGGGISILSSQLLGNSDFSTGAFAAEYGNALSGIFDLKLRKGNNEKREYTFQAGLLGVDLSTEGPFKKGYEGSYLVNYRYSTLSVLGKLGVPLGDAITNFQDLSFNVSLPTKRSGTFGLFGFGGLSNQTSLAKKDSALWEENDYYQLNTRFYSNTGAIGLTNTKLFENRSYLRTILAVSGTENGSGAEKLEKDYTTLSKISGEGYLQSKFTFSSVYTKKVNALSSIRTGLIINQLNYNLSMKTTQDTGVALIEKIHSDGGSQTIQAFFQWNCKIAPSFTGNAGIHYIQFFLNNSHSAEPRASFKYEINPKHNVSFGYGLHSQLQTIGLYFVKTDAGANHNEMPNKNLGLSKSHHFVLGYEWNVNEYAHVKTEFYYQHLYNVPVSSDITSTYSVLNSIWDYHTEALVNKGLGKNYGADLTFERFMHKNLYYIVSASFFDSKYKAPNNQWYNTRFNTNYATVLTLGKEWILSEKRKKRVIGLNLKSMYVGGFCYTPIDLPASVATGEVQYVVSKTFEGKNPDYWRVDIRVSVKRNYNRATGTLALDIQNTTNHKNVGGEYFVLKSGQIKYWYQTPLIPVLSYRLEF
jgi:CarboxypepD_reg-like domain